MLAARPALADLDTSEGDERRALHHAVLSRSAEMVRVLMEHGADARKGVWPHRDATGALTLALDRGDDAIVNVIREAEQRRAVAGRPATPAPAAPLATMPQMSAARAVASGDVGWLREACARGERWTSADGLCALAVEHNQPGALALLLERGLDPDQRVRLDYVDEHVESWGEPLRCCALRGRHAMAGMLLTAGADPNGRVLRGQLGALRGLRRRGRRHDRPAGTIRRARRCRRGGQVRHARSRAGSAGRRRGGCR